MSEKLGSLGSTVVSWGDTGGGLETWTGSQEGGAGRLHTAPKPRLPRPQPSFWPCPSNSRQSLALLSPAASRRLPRTPPSVHPRPFPPPSLKEDGATGERPRAERGMSATPSRSRHPLRPRPATREPPLPVRAPSRAERAPPRAVPPLRAARSTPARLTPLMDRSKHGGGSAPASRARSRGGHWEM